jgi:hypothetical protein
MIVYGLADAENFLFSEMNSEGTKQFLIENHLEEPLRLAVGIVNHELRVSAFLVLMLCYLELAQAMGRTNH